MLVSQLDQFLLSIRIVIICAGLASFIPDCKCWGMHLTRIATTTVSFFCMSPLLTNSTLPLWPFWGII